MNSFKIKEYKATKAGFGEGLLKAGYANKKVFAIGTDITSSVGMNLFAEKFPERFISLGIAEQNAVGVAAGLALKGKIPVFSTYGVFAAMRTLDQIRVSVCYNNLHVIIGGAHAGISVGPDGATHQALEDIAVMRVLPNMTLFSSCDATQTIAAVIAAVEKNMGPAYIRFGREAVPDFTSDELEFDIGKGQLFCEGNDATIIATGHLVWEALEASRQLKAQGKNIRVINIHTIKPLDDELIIKAANETGRIIVAEEHQIFGGLGGAVAELLAQHYPVPIRFVGMNDCYGESGKPEELIRKYKLNAAGIIEKVKQIID